MFTSTFRSALASDTKYSNEFKESQKALLDDFSSKRMMMKEMWDERINLFKGYGNCVVRSIYQFYYCLDSKYYDNAISKRKIYDWQYPFEGTGVNDVRRIGDYKYAVEDFRYPQKELKHKLEEFYKKACSFIPKPDAVEKLQQMYSDIKAAEGDVKKWVEALMAFDDHEFTFHNVEYRLGKDMKNKDLWLLYIEYLKSHDTQKLLQTYSKFIRFFLEDAEMIAEYREAVKKYGPVLVPWKNPEDFETYDANFFEKEKSYQSYKRTFYDEIPPLLIRFNPETAARQNFLFFQNPMMTYILENASPEALHKLYKCCKLFRVRFPKTICCRMTVDNGKPSLAIKGLAINITGSWALNIPFDNVFIGDSFFIHSLHRLALSDFIPKIYRCTANYVYICGQKLALDELQKLIGHENLSSLIFWGNCNSDEQYFEIEDILQMTPYIKEIELYSVQSTSKTAKKLLEMEFKNKIERIYLGDLKNDLLDPHDFAKFITKNCSSGASVNMVFNFEGQEAYAEKFKQVMKAAIKNHKIKFEIYD